MYICIYIIHTYIYIYIYVYDNLRRRLNVIAENRSNEQLLGELRGAPKSGARWHAATGKVTKKHMQDLRTNEHVRGLRANEHIQGLQTTYMYA